MSDELARWAAQRAPDLLARAEEQAVAVLRDALVASALGADARPAQRRPSPAAPTAAPAQEDGHLLWAYCVLPASATVPDGLAGVAGAAVEAVREGPLVALVGRVPQREFAAEPLRANLNDLPWLEQVARAHEAVLERVLGQATVVPLRLCTIFEDRDGVRTMLAREADSLARALDHLGGRQEWGVKLLVDPARLMDEAGRQSDRPGVLDAESESTTEGAGYLLRRRRERHVRELADAMAADIADDVHARLQDWALDAVQLPVQNRELSGHAGEMLLNAAYLVEADRVDGLRRLVGKLEQRHGGLGARLELTGPWPPYNFVPGATASGAP